jgi:hypothetical protein
VSALGSPLRQEAQRASTELEQCQGELIGKLFRLSWDGPRVFLESVFEREGA